MSKITFSNKYLNKQNLVIGTMACLLVIVLMVLQLSNVDMQSGKTQGPRVVGNSGAPKDEINWNNVDLNKLSIPNSIKSELNSNEIKDSTIKLQVLWHTLVIRQFVI